MAYASNGPVSSLPYSLHKVPEGCLCDNEHSEPRPAIARIQTETDSFGAEYADVCEECRDALLASREEERNGCCDWCNTYAKDLRHTRDYDEGSCGRVYRVCGPCRVRDTEYEDDQ